MLPYHFRAREEERGFFLLLSMVLFGFEGDEIQIRLTSSPWNLMSRADSGNYLLCKLGCSLEPETSRASPSYVAARLSLLLLLLSFTISPSAPKTTLLFSPPCSKCKIIHFPFTTLTEAVPHVRLKAWLASFDLCSQY